MTAEGEASTNSEGPCLSSEMLREPPFGHRLSKDGRYFVPNWRVWVCPACGRSTKVPEAATYTPNTHCQCELPHCVTQMVEVTSLLREQSAATR